MIKEKRENQENRSQLQVLTSSIFIKFTATFTSNQKSDPHFLQNNTSAICKTCTEVAETVVQDLG